jgi:hypothetical protein
VNRRRAAHTECVETSPGVVFSRDQIMLWKPRRLRHSRRGIAIAELSVVLAVLLFISLAACDFGRSFYNSVILENCAANGAIYGSNPTLAAQMPYTSVTAAALADWPASLNPQPTVSAKNGTNSNGTSYIDVTVNQSFPTLVKYPFIPSTLYLSRTVRMDIVP